jgi:hypothetical protein
VFLQDLDDWTRFKISAGNIELANILGFDLLLSLNLGVETNLVFLDDFNFFILGHSLANSLQISE